VAAERVKDLRMQGIVVFDATECGVAAAVGRHATAGLGNMRLA